MNMEILNEADQNQKKKKCGFYSLVISYFDRPEKKIEKKLLKHAINANYVGFKQILLVFYQFYAERIIYFLILVSLIDQITVLSLSDNLLIDIGKITQIDIVFSIEIILNFLFTIDFILKICLHRFFMDSNIYGIGYLVCDCLSGPIILLYDFFTIGYYKKYPFFGFILRSLKVMTLKFIRKLLNRLRIIMPKMNPLIWSLFVFFYVFSYFAQLLYYDALPEFFSTLSQSLFTMFQFLTLDSWGMLGRLILEEKGIFSAYYVAFFIFIMTYFFLNILLGFLVDYLTPELKETKNGSNLLNEQRVIAELEEENLIASFTVGKWFDRIVILFFLLSIFETQTYVRLNDYKGNLAICYEITVDTIILFNFILWVYYVFKEKDQKRNYFILAYIFVFKVISGPLAFFLDSIYYFNGSPYLIGHYFRILQILSTKTLTKFIFSYFPIFPKIGYPFLTLIGLITFLACWTTERLGSALPEFFNNFNLSLYSFIQMLSLDEWCNTVTRGILADALESALIFIVFIFVANYILLNVMLAIACSEIMSQENDSDNLNVKFEPPVSKKIIKNALSTVLQNLLCLISFNHQFMFKKLQKNNDLDLLLKTQKKVQIVEPDEINSFYSLKQILVNPNKEKIIFLEYNGNKIACNSLHYLELNKNIEIISEENIEKSMFSTLNSDEQGNYFEIEMPTNQKKNFFSSIRERMNHFMGKLFKRPTKGESFHSFFS